MAALDQKAQLDILTHFFARKGIAKAYHSDFGMHRETLRRYPEVREDVERRAIVSGDLRPDWRENPPMITPPPLPRGPKRPGEAGRIHDCWSEDPVDYRAICKERMKPRAFAEVDNLASRFIGASASRIDRDDLWSQLRHQPKLHGYIRQSLFHNGELKPCRHKAADHSTHSHHGRRDV